MKKITLLSLLLVALASVAAADVNDVLAYVAMPLAVSSVCDVRGVQTDRVGELVTYMDRANVAPADFVDVFRYVPVALVMRTDGRPDFVQWVGSQVDSGIVGTALVSAMETRLRTYDDYVPIASPRPRRTYRSYQPQDYAYAYEPDYVPVVIRQHCERLVMEPLSLVEMPVAVTNVYDLGIPHPLVSSFVAELNLGRVPPLQFVELMRYAPAALVADGSYGQRPFVDYVRSERIGGATGYQLVQVVDRRLRAYDVAPVIDPAPVYVRSQYANVRTVLPQQNWVDPLSSAWVPPVVRTRVAERFAPARTTYVQAPAIAAAPQVQRFLESPNGGAVVTNPGQARHELARANRAQREAPIAAAPAFVASPMNEHRGHGREMAAVKRGRGRRDVVASPAVMPAMPAPAPVAVRRGRGHGAEGKVHGRPQANRIDAPPAFAVPPPAVREHGRGNQKFQPAMVAPPAPAPQPSAAPANKGHGHGHGGQQAAFVPLPAPAAAAPPAAPPGQEKKHGKDKHK